MRISQSGINLIKQFEGLELEAYQDVADIWTIGYGHTGPDVEPGQSIGEAEAEELLRVDLQQFEAGVFKAVQVDVTQNQFDALVSLTYNIGVRAFCESTALRRLNEQNFLGAAEAIRWWNKATINGVCQEVLGLTRRRLAEAALFLEDITRANAGTDVVDVLEKSVRILPEENKPRRGNLAGSRTMGGAAIAGVGGVLGVGSATMGEKNDTVPLEESNAHTGQPTIEQQMPDEGVLIRSDYSEAMQVAAGVIVILGVLYVIFARIDDWRQNRR